MKWKRNENENTDYDDESSIVIHVIVPFDDNKDCHNDPNACCCCCANPFKPRLQSGADDSKNDRRKIVIRPSNPSNKYRIVAITAISLICLIGIIFSISLLIIWSDHHHHSSSSSTNNLWKKRRSNNVTNGTTFDLLMNCSSIYLASTTNATRCININNSTDDIDNSDSGSMIHMNKTEWPELYLMDYKIAIAVIKSERPDITIIDVIHVAEDDHGDSNNDTSTYNRTTTWNDVDNNTIYRTVRTTTSSSNQSSTSLPSNDDDYQNDRVRLYVNDEQLVIRIPQIG